MKKANFLKRCSYVDRDRENATPDTLGRAERSSSQWLAPAAAQTRARSPPPSRQRRRPQRERHSVGNLRGDGRALARRSCDSASPSERCCARRWLRNMRPPHALRRDRASISAGTTSVRRLGECQLMPAVLPAALIQAASLPSGATLQATKPATSSHQWQRYTLHLLASCY